MINKLRPFRVVTLISLFALLLSSCENEDNRPQKGKVEFTFRDISTSGSGRKSSESVRHLLITVEDLSGNTVYNKKKIELLGFGDEFISEPVEFQPGNFRLTEFLVLDESGNVGYATPLEGSTLADLVEDPLGAEFNIIKDGVTKVTPQVVSIEGFSAADFGYASFTLDIVETISFQIATFVFNTTTHNLELTTSSLTVSTDSLTLHNGNLPAATNVVVVKDGFDSYKIRVSKDGYLSYEKSFTAAELAAYQSSAVLKITLFEDTDKSMYFDGVNDYIDLGNIYDSVQFPITISAWINLDSTQQYVGAIFDSQDNDAIYNGFQFAVTTTALFLQYGDGRGQNHPDYRGGKSSTGNDIPGKWMHITAVVRGESNISLFINGVDVGGTEQGDSPYPMNSNFPNAFASIGRSTANGLQLFFKGYMDDVTIWNTAIRRADVPALMTKNFSGGESGLIGHWNFNEASGETVLDKSMFGYNGVIKGGAYRVSSTAPNN